MNKSEMTVRLADTIQTLLDEVASNKEAGKSIGRIQRKAKLLGVVKELIEVYAPEEFSLNTAADLEQALNPKKGKKAVFEVKEGDNVIELLDKYNDVKDVYHKLQDAWTAAGLKMVGQVLVKA